MAPLEIQALALDVPLEPVSAEQVIEGSPQTGLMECEATAHYEWGVWEMTPGVMWDIEVDETFVVIGGEGTLIRERDGVSHTVALRPGVVVTLSAGERNTWRVEQTLRKVWFCPLPD